MALSARGVDVITPPNKSELARLETLVTGDKFAPVFKGFYSEFGGYASHDNENHKDLWSLDNIVEHLYLSKLVNGKRFWAIGDLLMHSDFIAADLVDDQSPILLLEEGRTISPSLSQFLLELVSGKFDLNP